MVKASDFGSEGLREGGPLMVMGGQFFFSFFQLKYVVRCLLVAILCIIDALVSIYTSKCA